MTYNDEPDYLALEWDLDRAAAFRWGIGRKRYGSNRFVGDELAEAAQEAPDLLNYLNVAQQNGSDAHHCQRARYLLEELWGLLGLLYTEREQARLVGRYARMDE